MKKILSTLGTKWPEYIIESFVIIASILGAFALDKWNQKRIDFNRALDYHNRLVENLDYLIEANENRLEKAQPILSSIVAATDMLNKGKLNAQDSTMFEFVLLNYGKFGNAVEQQLTVFDEMKSNGDLDLIYNTELRKQLTKFNARLNSYEDILKSIDEKITESQFYFDMFSRIKVDLATGKTNVQYDFKRMSTSTDFINRFSRNANLWKIQVEFSLSHIKDILALREKVIAELNQLQN